MVEPKDSNSAKRFSLKRFTTCLFVMLGIGIILAAGAVIVLLYPMYTESLVIMRYTAEKPLWLKTVKISNTVAWKSGDAHELKTFSKPGQGVSFSTFFTAPKEMVPAEVIVEDKSHNPSAFTCMLDNRDRPCLFHIEFDGHELLCHPCQNMLD